MIGAKSHATLPRILNPPEPNKLRPAVVLQPSPTNGCKTVSDLHPQHLTCIAKTRITAATNSVISPAELQ